MLKDYADDEIDRVIKWLLIHDPGNLNNQIPLTAMKLEVYNF